MSINIHKDIQGDRSSDEYSSDIVILSSCVVILFLYCWIGCVYILIKVIKWKGNSEVPQNYVSLSDIDTENI